MLEQIVRARVDAYNTSDDTDEDAKLKPLEKAAAYIDDVCGISSDVGIMRYPRVLPDNTESNTLFSIDADEILEAVAQMQDDVCAEGPEGLKSVKDLWKYHKLPPVRLRRGFTQGPSINMHVKHTKHNPDLFRECDRA